MILVCMKKRPNRQPIYPSRTPTVTGALSAGRAHFPQARSWGKRTHFQQETADGWGGRCGPRREEVTIGKRSPNVPHCPSALYFKALPLGNQNPHPENLPVVGSASRQGSVALQLGRIGLVHSGSHAGSLTVTLRNRTLATGRPGPMAFSGTQREQECPILRENPQNARCLSGR